MVAWPDVFFRKEYILLVFQEIQEKHKFAYPHRSVLLTLMIKKISSELVIFGISIHHIYTNAKFYNKLNY